MRDRPKTIISTKTGQKVQIKDLEEHEKTWIDPRHGRKFVLEDLRPIPEHNGDESESDMNKKVGECQYCSRRMLIGILKEHEEFQ